MTYEVIILGHLHMPLYFIGTFTEYSYLLYCDSKNKDLSISNNNFEIHQFDWQGRFLKRYRLNHYILSFCVDEKSDRIYAISFQNNKNFSPEILCYSLSSTN